MSFSPKIRPFFTFLILIVCFLIPILAQSTIWKLDATRTQINIPGVPSQYTFAQTQGDPSNQAYETITTKDAKGNLAPNAVFHFWLSDSAACAGITATASSGTFGMTIANGTPGSGSNVGSLLGAGVVSSGLTAGTYNVTNSRVPLTVQSDATATAKIGVIDSAKTLFYPCAYSLMSGVKVGTRFTAALYK